MREIHLVLYAGTQMMQPRNEWIKAHAQPTHPVSPFSVTRSTRTVLSGAVRLFIGAKYWGLPRICRYCETRATQKRSY